MNADELVDDAGYIRIDLRCSECGYNLRGLHWKGLCPECSAAIIHSTIPNTLQRAARSRLDVINIGLGLVSSGTVFLVCSLPLGHYQPILCIVAIAAWAVGMWLITIRPFISESRSARVQYRWSRVAVRFASTLSAGAGCVAIARSFAAASASGLVLIMMLLAAVGWYAAELGASVISERLAKLIPNSELAKFIAWTGRFSVIGPVPLLATFATAVVSENVSGGRLRRFAGPSVSWAWLMGAFAITTALWLMFTLAARFRLASNIRKKFALRSGGRQDKG